MRSMTHNRVRALLTSWLQFSVWGCKLSRAILSANKELVQIVAALWALLVVMTWVFHNIEPLAGYLQLPYLAWVSFASVLNYTLLKLNTRPVGCAA